MNTKKPLVWSTAALNRRADYLEQTKDELSMAELQTLKEAIIQWCHQPPSMQELDWYQACWKLLGNINQRWDEQMDMQCELIGMLQQHWPEQGQLAHHQMMTTHTQALKLNWSWDTFMSTWYFYHKTDVFPKNEKTASHWKMFWRACMKRTSQKDLFSRYSAIKVPADMWARWNDLQKSYGYESSKGLVLLNNQVAAYIIQDRGSHVLNTLEPSLWEVWPSMVNTHYQGAEKEKWVSLVLTCLAESQNSDDVLSIWQNLFAKNPDWVDEFVLPWIQQKKEPFRRWNWWAVLPTDYHAQVTDMYVQHLHTLPSDQKQAFMSHAAYWCDSVQWTKDTLQCLAESYVAYEDNRVRFFIEPTSDPYDGRNQRVDFIASLPPELENQLYASSAHVCRFLNVFVKAQVPVTECLFEHISRVSEEQCEDFELVDSGISQYSHFPYANGPTVLLRAMQHKDPSWSQCSIDPLPLLGTRQFVAAHLYNAWRTQYPELAWPPFEDVVQLGTALDMPWTDTLRHYRDVLRRDEALRTQALPENTDLSIA